MLTGALVDWVGADVGGCRLLELPELLELEPELPELVEPLDELEPELEEDEEPESSDELELEREACGRADGCVPWDDAWRADDVACAGPGSRTVTTPAAVRLATETAVVADASFFLPRSRSATARATAEGRLVRNCGLLMPASVPCQLMRGVRPRSEAAMSLVALPPNGRGQRHSGTAIMAR